jgi:hypothetical protein
MRSLVTDGGVSSARNVVGSRRPRDHTVGEFGDGDDLLSRLRAIEAEDQQRMAALTRAKYRMNGLGTGLRTTKSFCALGAQKEGIDASWARRT